VFKPRASQQEVIDFERGWMGVSAVPGSGKTRTLSALAAKLITGDYLKPHQEVLIVTLVNAAVDHFARQVAELVKEGGLLPNVGYRVRTLHGLANDIVRERPSLVDLDEKFTIVDERDTEEILQETVSSYFRTNAFALDEYLRADLSERELQRFKSMDGERELKTIAANFIRQAKDLQMMPYDVRRALDAYGQPLHLAEMALAIYTQYQEGLRYRGAVDFQDLIRLALLALERDPQYCDRLRARWPYILEDEAQDSSELQEQILRKLLGDSGHWVRVGDPNQAIYETFTTASPEFLRRFLKEKKVKAKTLPYSGRSTASVIKLANHLIKWTGKSHPSERVRALKPLTTPEIKAVPKRDPQPNPKDRPDQIHIRMEKYTAQEELDAVTRSVKRWLEEHPDETAAVLVPRSDRGSQVAELLRKMDVPYVELLRTTSVTRRVAGALTLICEYLTQPLSPSALVNVYRVWQRDSRNDSDRNQKVQAVVKALRGVRTVESFVYPTLEADWLESDANMRELIAQDDFLLETMQQFRALLQRWQAAATLPIDQLVLTLAQDLFQEAVELATAHSIAVYLRKDADNHPERRLPHYTQELREISRNRRAVTGVSAEDTGFDPDAHKGMVTVATMHKAKGLEWDRVYIMSVNNYDFPSGDSFDSYISERYFVRDRLNLEAEACAQLSAIKQRKPYVEGDASSESRYAYIAERLRLLFVGITRARKELVMTWNTGRDGELVPSAPLVALSSFWEQER